MVVIRHGRDKINRQKDVINDSEITFRILK